MQVLAFLIAIFSLYLALENKKRLEGIEKKLKSSVPTVQPVQQTTQKQETLQQKTTPVKQFKIPEPTEFEKQVNYFVYWLKEDWLLKAGILILLIGFGWFVSYAFLNNWIGPIGRISFGLIMGTLVLLFGWQRIKKFIHQGAAFLVFGSTIILITIFAARHIYEFFTPASALAITLLSTAFVAFVSVKYKNRNLAMANIILAGVAPLLVNSPSNYIGLFAYLMIVVIGSIWIVALIDKRELITTALAIVFLHSLPMFALSISIKGTLLVFAYGFTSIFLLTTILSVIKNQNTKTNKADLITSIGTGIFLLSWILSAAPREWQSLIISAWMVVVLFSAFLLFKKTQNKSFFYTYASVGILYLAVATGLEFSGDKLTIAYTIETSIIVYLTYKLFKNKNLTEQVSLLYFVPIMLSLQSLVASTWRTNVLHYDFLVLLMLGMIMLGYGFIFYSDKETDLDLLGRIYLIIGSLYSYALIWKCTHTIFVNDDNAVMTSLLIYTVLGIGFHFYGISKEKDSLKIYGTVLLSFVIGRLLLVDVWDMNLAGRIITFFLIGSLLVSTAFINVKTLNSKKEVEHEI